MCIRDSSWTAAAGTTREQIKAHLAGLWADPDTAPDYVLLAASYTHLRAHETVLDLVCRLLLEKNKSKTDA